MNNFRIFDNLYFLKHILVISEKAGVITNSSPYISLEHKEYIVKKENKKNGLIKKILLLILEM